MDLGRRKPLRADVATAAVGAALFVVVFNLADARVGWLTSGYRLAERALPSRGSWGETTPSSVSPSAAGTPTCSRAATVTGGFVPDPDHSDHRPVIMDVVL